MVVFEGTRCSRACSSVKPSRLLRSAVRYPSSSSSRRPRRSTVQASDSEPHMVEAPYPSVVLGLESVLRLLGLVAVDRASGEGERRRIGSRSAVSDVERWQASVLGSRRGLAELRQQVLLLRP
jgi:hypothetical protein